MHYRSLSLRRIKVTGSLAAPLHCGGQPLFDAVLRGGSASGLSAIRAARFFLTDADGDGDERTRGITAGRLAVFGDRHELLPAGRDDGGVELMYRDNTLHASRIGAFTATGSIDFAGQDASNVFITSGKVNIACCVFLSFSSPTSRRATVDETEQGEYPPLTNAPSHIASLSELPGFRLCFVDARR